jgi:hypothetical protein
MVRYTIIDHRWQGDAIGGLFFLATTTTVLYVWLFCMCPIEDHVISMVFYCFVASGLVGVAVIILINGFTYRYIDVDGNCLAIHEGFYYLIWHKKLVPRKQIRSVERYVDTRQGAFTHVPISGVRIHLYDGSSLALVESDGKTQHLQDVVEVQRILDLTN